MAADLGARFERGVGRQGFFQEDPELGDPLLLVARCRIDLVLSSLKGCQSFDPVLERMNEAADACMRQIWDRVQAIKRRRRNRAKQTVL